ncbi:hypothetical protein CGCSCA4_v015039 [Colletotrichum siamense]|uniref:Uncharacterized protein n=1 Tax=Colletotrichum siamense TaxID=690259 RepID=A0A9P5EPS7_COLSI|nr:hypothetical protein CGCSCA4_v015039 [Colletotrichum siamense]KAF4857494.1 hypothetical protein CGCSCA2_v008385 [Colletotrichum siamense]
MGRTKCEYDAGPDVTRFAALKSRHEELQHRVSLFEELFRLLSMRSEAESVEIIRRVRITNIETDLDDLIKFIKNADLLIQLASTQSAEASPAPGTDFGPHGPLPMDEFSSLVELLKSAISKLDPAARTAFMDAIRIQVEALTASQDLRLDSAAATKGEAMTDGDTDTELDGVPHARPGGFLKGLLNDDPNGPN